MTAEEIRNSATIFAKKMVGFPVGNAPAEAIVALVATTTEIAAQLAELNATLHSFSNKSDGEPTAAMLDIRVNS